MRDLSKDQVYWAVVITLAAHRRLYEENGKEKAREDFENVVAHYSEGDDEIFECKEDLIEYFDLDLQGTGFQVNKLMEGVSYYNPKISELQKAYDLIFKELTRYPEDKEVSVYSGADKLALVLDALRNHPNGVVSKPGKEFLVHTRYGYYVRRVAPDEVVVMNAPANVFHGMRSEGELFFAKESAFTELAVVSHLPFNEYSHLRVNQAAETGARMVFRV